jgi:hypothetical protein
VKLLLLLLLQKAPMQQMRAWQELVCCLQQA